LPAAATSLAEILEPITDENADSNLVGATTIPLVPDTGDTSVVADDSASTTDTDADSLSNATTLGEEDASTIPASTTPPPTTDSTTNTDSAPAQSISGNVFESGAVTFRFDDGWSSQLDAAVPILDAAGIKGTYYIVPSQTADAGFTGFMSKAQVLELASNGSEIGAHTRTHPHLPTLSNSGQIQEIAGSKQDLESWGLSPQSFSFPYGEYNADSVQIVKDAGFSSAVTTVGTPASQSSDPFQISGPSITSSQSPAEIKAIIDAAIENHQWLILAFHRIDYSGDAYSITPENFQEVVNYVKSRGIQTVTVSQGASELR
jgi:peptidoglycan/xylan/chitin deacetylase (PgdA/CDA1 family)